MISYELDTVLSFGKFKSKSIKEIIEIQPSYINWCILNLNHFYMTKNTLEQITKIKKNFHLSEKETEVLKNKYFEYINFKRNSFEIKVEYDSLMKIITGNFDDDINENTNYTDEIDNETWGQKMKLCNDADDCFSCPHAHDCF